MTNIKTSRNLTTRFLYILVCFVATETQLEQFTQFIKDIHRKLNFTIEIGTNCSINPINLTITRLNNKHEFSYILQLHGYQQLFKIAAF